VRANFNFPLALSPDMPNTGVFSKCSTTIMKEHNKLHIGTYVRDKNTFLLKLLREVHLLGSSPHITCILIARIVFIPKQTAVNYHILN
jgi:hypothetical protein